MVRGAAVGLAAGVLAATLAPLVVGTGPTHLLVGYDPGNDDAATLAIRASGGEVERTSPEIGVARVVTSDPDNFRRMASLQSAIQYVEDDAVASLAAAQWNGAQWNAAQWNGAQWNGAQWNGAQWN